MRIFIPFTKLYAETLISVRNAECVPIVGQYGYASYFRDRWKVAETFINVEHDIVVNNTLLNELWYCPSIICLTKTILSPGSLPAHWHLGCVKISAEFIRKYPIKWDKQVYTDCDSTIWTAYGGDNKPVCVHGEVKHLHYA